MGDGKVEAKIVQTMEGGTFSGQLKELVFPTGVVKAVMVMKYKDASGRTFTATLAGQGKDRDSAVEALEAEFARRPIRISGMALKLLEAARPIMVAQDGSQTAAAPAQESSMAAELSLAQLKRIAKARGIKVEKGMGIDQLKALISAKAPAAAPAAPAAAPAAGPGTPGWGPKAERTDDPNGPASGDGF